MRWLLGVGLGYLGVEMTCFTILDTGIRTGLLMQEDDQLDNQPKSSSMATQLLNEDDALLLLTVLR